MAGGEGIVTCGPTTGNEGRVELVSQPVALSASASEITSDALMVDLLEFALLIT